MKSLSILLIFQSQILQVYYQMFQHNLDCRCRWFLILESGLQWMWSLCFNTQCFAYRAIRMSWLPDWRFQPFDKLGFRWLWILVGIWLWLYFPHRRSWTVQKWTGKLRPVRLCCCWAIVHLLWQHRCCWQGRLEIQLYRIIYCKKSPYYRTWGRR